MTWQLQEAKNKFSQLVEETLAHGPQIVTRRGQKTVVVIDYKTYAKETKPVKTFQEIINEYAGLDFPDIPREPGEGRATPFRFDEDY